MIEGVLPYVIQVWFIALFIGASHGKSRIVGAVTMSVVLGFEIAGLVGPVVGLDVPSLKVLFLLPFVWLLFESAKRRSATAPKREAPIRPALILGAVAIALVAAGCITPSDPRLDDSSRIETHPTATISRAA